VKRAHCAKVVEDALDSIPPEFRKRIRNVAVLIEDMAPNQRALKLEEQGRLLLGVFHGVPTTKKSIYLTCRADPITSSFYQKNIEAVCSNDAEVREQPPDCHP
jgi:predicted Zn-dependent protease with MMP-like domain